MFERTNEFLPPKHEVLAVRRKVIAQYQPLFMDSEAIWDGDHWVDQRTKDIHDKDYYYLWRKLET